ncbi:MAG: helix-turn-helix transcriptional regulator [Clostridia bacterium]|nr:helix-turn-helix transcriptional regulator [Clostridia bacterium]
MNYERNYHNDDLKVWFVNCDEGKGIPEDYIDRYINNYSDYYNIDFANSEDTVVIIDGKVFHYKGKILVFSKPGLNLKLQCLKEPYNFLSLKIHPNIFKNFQDNDKFLQFFYNLNENEVVIDLDAPQFDSLNTCVNLVLTALFARCGRFAMESRINTLISEMSLIYETNYKEYIASTDSIPAQIMDFIKKHYLEKITLQTISDKFFVSFNTTNAIVKQYTGKTFKQYITTRRLKTANDLIDSGNHSIYTIANLAGYSDYSAFIKAYKKTFGITPTEKARKNNTYYPLRK